MTTVFMLERTVHFSRGAKGRTELSAVPEPAPVVGRLPRVARLLALAHRLQRLVRNGTVKGYADLACLGRVSRARITQIMNLVLLAPDIQEEVLFLPRVERGRDPVLLAQLQPIAQERDWGQQRRLWRQLRTTKSPTCPRMASACPRG